MARSRSQSLSFQLQIVILPTLLVLFILLGTVLFQRMVAVDTANHLERSNSVIDQTEGALKLWLETNRETLVALAQTEAVLGAVENKTSRQAHDRATLLLEQFQAALPFATILALTDVDPTGRSLTVEGPAGPVSITNGRMFVESLKGKGMGLDLSDRDYFQKVVAGQDFWIGAPYISKSTKEPIFVLAVPVKTGGKVQAVLVLGVQLKHFTDLFVDPVKFGTGYLAVVFRDGQLLAHPKKEWILSDAVPDDAKAILQRVVKGETSFSDSLGGVPRRYFGKSFNAGNMDDWYFFVSKPEAEIYLTANETGLLIIGALVLMQILVGWMILFLVRRTVVRPIDGLGAKLAEIAQGGGDLTQSLEIRRQDELGAVASSFNGFMASLKAMVGGVKADNQKVLAGAQALAASASQSASAITEISSSVGTMAGNGQRQKDMTLAANRDLDSLFSNIDRINAMTEQMRASLGQSSAAIEEMASNIDSTAEMARRADAASRTLEEASLRGETSMAALIGGIERGASSSARIQEMIRLIMNIAGQTNLLAMNAAIEAAHAGEAGRGFAVVADEIRKLADQSGKSAKDIQTVVKEISQGSSVSLTQSGAARESFNTLKTEVERVRNANHEISSAMDEQKAANQSILTIVGELNTLAATISQELAAQVDRGRSMETQLKDLGQLSQEVAAAMDEERSALQEAAGSAEHIRTIASELSAIAERVEQEFRRFKTE